MKKRGKLRSDDEFLRVDYDRDLLETIETALGSMKDQKYKVLKNAVNATAKDSRDRLIAKTKEKYTEAKSAISKGTDLEKAKLSKPEATISVVSGAQELKGVFKTSNSKKSGAKAQILTRGHLKMLQSQKGNRAKAFLATFESGHTAVVQRQEGETYKRDAAKRQAKYGSHADMTRIKKLLSISLPQMMGGSKVLSEIEPTIYDHLLDNVNREIERVLKG